MVLAQLLDSIFPTFERSSCCRLPSVQAQLLTALLGNSALLNKKLMTDSVLYAQATDEQ